MKLLKAVGLLVLVLGFIPLSTAQASHNYDRDKFCEKLKKYYPKYWEKYCKPKEKPVCDYDLRDGGFYHNANNRPTDGNGKPTQNELIVFLRDKKTGGLSVPPANKWFDTHRVKSGGFGNQPGIVTSGQWSVIHTGEGDEQYVFMINAGFDVTQKDYYYDDKGKKQSRKIDRSGSVSAFKITKCEAKLTDVISTYGQEPRSVDRDVSYHADWKDWYKSQRDLVTVVNAGSGEVEFNGCPGLPEGFLAPTGITCGERGPVKDFDPTSVVVYKFDAKKGKFSKVAFAETQDEDGDPAQSAFVNSGKQIIVAQRNTFFALGDGKEDDIVEVFNLDKWGKIVGKSVVSQTTGNDNFGFSVLENPSVFNDKAPKDAESCVFMSHGSFQQRDQGGVSIFAVNKETGKTISYIPNKPDGGSDTCWTAISRTGTLYTSAFFDSEISIRGIVVDDDGCCNMVDGGPPVIAPDGVPQFTGDVANTGQPWAFPTNAGYKHRVTSSLIFKGGPVNLPELNQPGCPDITNPGCRNGDQALVTDQSDFLFEAGGLDMDVSKHKDAPEYLYVLWTPVPFSLGQDNDKNWLWPSASAAITYFKVVEDCGAPGSRPSIYEDGCRVGDLEFVGYVPGIPGQGFGVAVK